MQIVSIDEAYLDLTGTERLHDTAWVAAQKIQRAVAMRAHGHFPDPVVLAVPLGLRRPTAKSAGTASRYEEFPDY